jgi:type VI secretion system protein ImpA
MADRIYFSDELLQPISAESPSGRDLRYEPLFSQILEARRADDNLSLGTWEKEEGRKAAQWDRVAELALGALRDSTKDLRVACFLAESSIHLDGFAGLRDCLRLIKELLYRFWDQGLFPAVEGGDLDYRASSLSWLNDRMPDVLYLVVPITARDGREENYSFVRYLRARQIGREDAIARLAGEKRETITGLLQQGWITLDAFDAAMKATKRAALESVCKSFEECYEQFLALEKIVDERFGQAAPPFSSAKESFEEMRRVLNQALKKKREEEPDAVPAAAPGESQAPQTTLAGFWTAGMPSDASGSWQEAEALVRAGSVDRGLQGMAALAAQETSGRARFMRKLMLVDVCRNAGRERLARTVLEELTKQIADYKLDQWESSALVGAVWSRLYRIYKKSEMSSEQDQAVVLYNQLCRLDPWQAYLDCED